MSISSETERLIALIEQSYPVGAVQSLTPAHHPQLGIPAGKEEINVWRVQTKNGNFCLKRHRAGKGPQRALLEEAIQREIHRINPVLVAELITTTDGLSGVEFAVNRFWLERFIQSSHFSWWQTEVEPDVCIAAGRGLFDFHQCSLTGPLKSFFSDIAGDASEKKSTGAIRAGNKLYRDCLDSLESGKHTLQLRSDSGDSIEWRSCVDACQTLLSSSQEAFKKLDCASPEDRRLVHGDYHAGNTLLFNSKLEAIVDFEDVRVEHWLYDLAYSLVMFSTRWQADEDDRKSTSEELRRTFLESYLERSSYSSTWQSELASYTLVACALIVCWLLQRFSHYASAGVKFHNKDLLKCLKRVQHVWDTALR
jgi:Ser/Thr protein kinase RdoA (MazF antagonist)